MSKLRIMLTATLVLGISMVTVLVMATPRASAATTPLFPHNELCQGVNSSDAPAICAESPDGTNPITGPRGVILRVANLIAFIGGVFAVFVIVVSGIRYMLSSGDSARINTAKNAILYSAIGLVIIALANTIVRFIVSKL